MYDHLHFEKLDEIEKVIRDHCADITHITMHEVADRSAYPQLGKVCFGAVDLGAFIEPDEEEEDPTDEDDDDDESDDESDDDDGDDDTEDEPSGDLGDLAKMDGGVTYRRLADAAIRWIKHLAGQNMIGEREGKFKVNLWRGKGDKVIYSSRFVATNLEWEEPAAVVVAPPAIPVTFPDNAPDPKTWRALGEGYTHLIGLLQTSYQHLAALQNSHISNQSAQLVRAQRSIEGVVGELTKLKIGIYEVETLKRGEGGGPSPVSGELGREFITQLGSLGRLIASTKFGMPAEMVELADIVGGSPELQDALKNPAVIKVLRDEKTRKELAALLKLAAAADAAPANDPTPPEAAAQAA